MFIKELAVTFFIKEIFTKVRISDISSIDVNLIIYISSSELVQFLLMFREKCASHNRLRKGKKKKIQSVYLIYNVKEFAADVRGCLLSYRVIKKITIFPNLLITWASYITRAQNRFLCNIKKRKEKRKEKKSLYMSIIRRDMDTYIYIRVYACIIYCV